MSVVPIAPSFYKVGGALPHNVPSYITRARDRELYEALKAGEFCYVFSSGQMGKSSLMVRTLAKLQAEDWAGIIIDFSAKDSQADLPDRWYNGIINQLNRQFKLLDRKDFRIWLKEQDFLSPVERLGEFIETILLPGIDRPIVIFIDEIDSTLNLPFTDYFFALIRACYNKRAENPNYQRLTFALFGVAAPSDLIGDPKGFNIGKSIDLKGFALTEALPLAEGLTGKSDRPQVVLQEILRWTGGQPFLTQRLCQLVVDSSFTITSGSEMTMIEGLVQSRLIENWESQDHQLHLKTIRKRLLDNEQKAGYLLELYRQIRQGGEIMAHNRPEERELQLSGLVVKRDGKLEVYNLIYEAVFDEAWINAELKKLRPYAERFPAQSASSKMDTLCLPQEKALMESEQRASKKNPSTNAEIFTSYAWGGESEEIVNQIDQDAQRKGITIIRDKRDAGFKAKIKEFMQRIGRGKAIIVVISKRYLESKNCMFELIEIAKNGQFYDRIFPIVLKDAHIYDPVERADYIIYWENKIQELDSKLKKIKSSANLTNLQEAITQYTESRATIDQLTYMLQNMNTLTSDIHQNSDFEALFQAIEDRMKT